MKLHHSLLASLLLAGCIGVGCNKPVETSGPSGTASATGSVATPVKPHFGKGKHGFRVGAGPAGLLFRAAYAQELTEAQKTKLDELAKSLRGDDATRDALKKLHEEIVAGVKAGKIDQTKVDAAQADVEKAMKAHREKEADALNGLHATLDAAQRKAVVAHLRDKMAKGAEYAGKWKKGGPGANLEGKGPGAFMLKKMTDDLKLDDAQQKKVEALLPKPEDKPAFDFEAMKKKNDEMLTAFEGDAFDAKKLDLFAAPPEAVAKKGHGFMDTKFLSELLPILTADQRETLAANLSKPKFDHPGKGPGAAPAPSAPEGDDGDDDDAP